MERNLRKVPTHFLSLIPLFTELTLSFLRTVTGLVASGACLTARDSGDGAKLASTEGAGRMRGAPC